MPGDTSLVKKVKNSNLKMLEVKSQRKNHDSDDTKSPRQEAVNDDSNILTGKPILVLIFVCLIRYLSTIFDKLMLETS